ncbi:MAG: diguanylate cyclase [Deltaproteobacteria bacterium]|jgi:diguanylate cyclase (GGDEF)-like protein|nr:diguanylate cyclase [Deltaproteobacteria bacterium]MBT7714425.1 diguanylate cyclase [Deltaproteobacteria bacterium]
MKFTNASEIDMLILKIEQSLEEHAQWVKLWHSKAICDRPFPDIYLDTNASDTCDFSEWFQSQQSAEWLHQLDYDAITAVHNTVHEEAVILSQKIMSKEEITEKDYYRFMNSEWNFSHQLQTLKDKISRLQISFDPLTGIFNRQAMMPILLQEHAYVGRDQKACCLAMADLDHFKKVNDTHGHPAGDKVLKAVASFFRTNLRPYDALFRYGGEEFLFCLPNTDIKSGSKLLNRLRIDLKKCPIQIKQGEVISVSISMGIMQMQAEQPVDEAIDNADAALYEAKKGGRNRVSEYKP